MVVVPSEAKKSAIWFCAATAACATGGVPLRLVRNACGF
jgi:hypothetical protein